MGAAVKIIIGLVMIVVGLGFFVDSVIPLSGTTGTFGIDWLANFFVVLTGVIPIFLILIGLFIVWLESDEMKSKKEIKKEPIKPVQEVKPARKK